MCFFFIVRHQDESRGQRKSPFADLLPISFIDGFRVQAKVCFMDLSNNLNVLNIEQFSSFIKHIHALPLGPRMTANAVRWPALHAPHFSDATNACVPRSKPSFLPEYVRCFTVMLIVPGPSPEARRITRKHHFRRSIWIGPKFAVIPSVDSPYSNRTPGVLADLSTWNYTRTLYTYRRLSVCGDLCPTLQNWI